MPRVSVAKQSGVRDKKKKNLDQSENKGTVLGVLGLNGHMTILS